MSNSTMESQGAQIIHLDGRVNYERTPAFRKILLEAVVHERDILVDFSAVTYIDSSGIACLIEALQIALSRGIRLALISVSVHVMRVLKLARLDMVFPIHTDFAAAVERG